MLKVGDDLWTYDRHMVHRVTEYHRAVIVGETPGTWLVINAMVAKAPDALRRATPVNKRTMRERGDRMGQGREYLTADGVAARRYVARHGHAIAEMIRKCDDPEKLRAVAALLGYVEPAAGGGA